MGPTILGPEGAHEQNHLGPRWATLLISHAGGQLGPDGAYLFCCLGNTSRATYILASFR